jgi:FixJ family two-component response regulator
MMLEPTVYIVDDDAAVRDSLALLLGLHGYQTQAFASAEDFLGA